MSAPLEQWAYFQLLFSTFVISERIRVTDTVSVFKYCSGSPGFEVPGAHKPEATKGCVTW